MATTVIINYPNDLSFEVLVKNPSVNECENFSRAKAKVASWLLKRKLVKNDKEAYNLVNSGDRHAYAKFCSNGETPFNAFEKLNKIFTINDTKTISINE